MTARVALILLAATGVLVAGCSRPTGDFGRPDHSVLHEKALPKVGRILAKERHEPVSSFRRTDEEKKLENLAWTIIRPLHTKDWISGTLIEATRTRTFPNANKRLDHKAYLFWLRLEPFNSSETRWNRIISDIRADQGAVTPFYDQARLVYVIDQQRVTFLEETPDLYDAYAPNTLARLKENEALIDQALNALEFRYAAYDYAVDRLTIETPSPRARHAREELERYRELIERGGDRGLPFFDNPELLSSRIANIEKDAEEAPVPQK